MVIGTHLTTNITEQSNQVISNIFKDREDLLKSCNDIFVIDVTTIFNMFKDELINKKWDVSLSCHIRLFKIVAETMIINFNNRNIDIEDDQWLDVAMEVLLEELSAGKHKSYLSEVLGSGLAGLVVDIFDVYKSLSVIGAFDHLDIGHGRYYPLDWQYSSNLLVVSIGRCSDA